MVYLACGGGSGGSGAAGEAVASIARLGFGRERRVEQAEGQLGGREMLQCAFVGWARGG
jgi:hypothetical protein